MLVFIDESGDTGLKIAQGSSQFFCVALVFFEDHDEAVACDQRIQLLKKELSWKEQSEFHFGRNSDKVRKLFLKTVAPYNFFYYGIVFNKNPGKLSNEVFKDRRSFYKYACGLVFENARSKLSEAIVVVDKSGNMEFRSELAKYLRAKTNKDKVLIKKFKMEKSSSNNLLQLADYIAGVINREIQDKKSAEGYNKLITRRKIEVEKWPKI